MKSILKKSICSIVAVTALFSGVVGAFGVSAKTARADSVAEPRYYDAPGIMLASGTDETISFARKEVEFLEFPYAVPNYYTLDLENACGPVAGAIVVGYYDKYYEDLIPDYTAYYTANGRYRMPDTTYIAGLISELYTLMQTNVVDVGVSESECLEGLRDYVEGKNRPITYTSVKSGSFNATAYKNAVINQQPVLLFCQSTSLYFLDLDETQDEILYVMSSSSHIVVGYGYYQIKYYDANDVNFRTDSYLKVATGWASNSWGYLKANDTSWLNSAYVVDIT